MITFNKKTSFTDIGLIANSALFMNWKTVTRQLQSNIDALSFTHNIINRAEIFIISFSFSSSYLHPPSTILLSPSAFSAAKMLKTHSTLHRADFFLSLYLNR